jgi:trehalose 6-phosphate phosphatase
VLKSPDIVSAWRNSALSGVLPSELVLITDFDGTLAEVVPDPAKAQALPESLAALRRLVELIADVIVLSSRTAADLEDRIPIPGVRLVGDSGRVLPRHAQRQALDKFNEDVSRLLEWTPGTWLEVKPASSAIHFRNANLSGEEMVALIQPLLDGARLSATAGRKVIEVHAPKGGKGAFLAAYLPAQDPGGVVSFGDDENDRSVFEYVSGLDVPHMAVGVYSPEAPKDLFDRCDLVVSGPAEAAALMTEIADWAAAWPAEAQV